MSHSTKIADLVGTIIDEADDSLKQKLAQALEDFAEQNTPAFMGVQNTPYATCLMEAMVEGSDARIDPAVIHANL